jgi:hypothetical protein
MWTGARRHIVLSRGRAFPSTLIGAIVLLFAPMLSPAATAQTADADFAARCHSATPDGLHASADGIVLRCFGFDDASQLPDHVPNGTCGSATCNRSYGYDYGVMAASGTPVIDTTVFASGNGRGRNGSMMMRNPVGGGSDSFGSWFTHFGVNKTHQLNAGDEIWVQYRVRWSPEMIVAANWPNGMGFKVKDISFGDLAACNPTAPDSINCPTSCPAQGATWVTQQYRSGQAPLQNYANCSGNFAYQGMYANPPVTIENGAGCLYPNFPVPPCVVPNANEWYTFKHHIKMGSFNSFSTTLQTWIGRQGQPTVLVVDCSATAANPCIRPDNGAAVTGWWLENSGGAQYKIGKIYLHPYMTNLSGALVSGAAWYDELIISTQDIADPGAPSSNIAPKAPCCLQLTQLGQMSFVILGVILLGGRRWYRCGPR